MLFIVIMSNLPDLPIEVMTPVAHTALRPGYDTLFNLTDLLALQVEDNCQLALLGPVICHQEITRSSVELSFYAVKPTDTLAT